MQSFAPSFVRTVADLICPERCAACQALVAAGVIFCHACRAHVNVQGPPECMGCGRPLATPLRCARCVSIPDPPVRYARAWATYRVDHEAQPVARALARFKYQGVTRLCRRMGQAMASRVPDLSVSMVIPVPLHEQRLRTRGFNQSALLARHVGRALHCRVDFGLLIRTRDTPTQTRANRRQRQASVADAFAVTRPPSVRDRTVLVIDDVWTSGATARSVAATLRAAGARAVDVVTFARVEHPVVSATPRD